MKRIFTSTGFFPIIQLLTLVFVGGVCLILAFNIRIGRYVSFEAEVRKSDSNYIICIPTSYRQKITQDASGKWSFSSIQGKYYLLKKTVSDNSKWLLETDQLSNSEKEKLEKTKKVYVDFLIKKVPLYRRNYGT